MELIKSRFYQQKLSENYIARHRLVDSLNVRNHKGFTLVSAPAGFGKTSLLVEWSEQCLCRTAWLSLTEQESDFYKFSCYLIGCIQFTLRLKLEKSSELCTKSIMGNFQLFFTTLINEIEDSGEAFNLILDDVHLADSDDIDQFIELFIKHLPSNVRFVLISREDPKLPLGKLRISPSYRELRAEQLKFNSLEIKDFFSQNVEETIDTKSLARIEVKTEGWIASLQLMALSLVGSKNIIQDIFEFSGNNHFIMEYLVESVLNTLSEKDVSFLVQTAAFERFTPELCDYTLGITESSEIIANLVASNLFLVPLDNKREWYRYHHLFSEILMALDFVKPNESSLLQQKAAQWFESNGYFREAVEHSFKSNDEEATLFRIEQYWPKLSNSESDELLIKWMQRISGDYLINFPYLYALFGLNLLSVDMPRGRQYLERIQLIGESAPLNDTVKTYMALVGLGNAYIFAASGEFDKVIPSAKNALSVLSNIKKLNDSEIIWLGSAYALIATSSWMKGDMELTISSLKKSIQYMQKSNNSGAVLSTHYMLLQAYNDQGDIRKAQHYNQTMLNLMQHFGEPYQQGGAEMYLMLALSEYEAGLFDKSREHLQFATHLSEQSKLREAAHKYSILRAKLNYFTNFQDKVNNDLIKAENIRIPNPIPDTYSPEYWRSRFALISGDDSYLSVMADDKEFDLAHTLTFNDEACFVVWLHWQVIKGNFTATNVNNALSVVNKLLSITSQNKRHRSYIELTIVKTQLLSQFNKEINFTDLIVVLTMAKELGLKQTLQLFPILKTLLKQQHIVEQIPKLVLSYARQSMLNNTQVEELKTLNAKTILSIKEKTVLRLLASDKTGPEICKELFVSLNTFRTHSKNIYSKLEVNSRMAAVKRATELQLL